ELALAVDSTSSLSSELKQKIYNAKKEAGLLFEELRNGRKVLDPRLFLSLSQELKQDSNVIYQPNDSSAPDSTAASTVSTTSIFSRYVFYHKDYMSITPEFTFANIYNLKRTN